MKVGLIDVDAAYFPARDFPNLALMKIAGYHRARGDTVDWWNGLEHYDLVYRSRVFDDTYTSDHATVIHADRIISGGTGYDLNNALPEVIEHHYPDYTLYPTGGKAYGFLTRGCPRACPFCIVSAKEGRRSRQGADLPEFWRGQKDIVLLDPNLLACPDHEVLLQQLADSGAWVDFTQGLDARLLNPDNIQLLKQVKTRMVHFAWDSEPESDLILRQLAAFRETTGYDHHRMAVYVLTNFDTSFEFDLHRVYTLRAMGIDPYVMIYNKPTAPERYIRLQGWVNNRIAWRVCDRFEDFDRRKRRVLGHAHA